MAKTSVATQIELSAEAVSDIRKALVYGLSCLNEVLRLREAAEEAAAAEQSTVLLQGSPAVLPAERPSQSLQAFADAFLWLSQEPAR